jgi:aryl-alcohol dehydrogenase-like predicted oxidoreductase
MGTAQLVRRYGVAHSGPVLDRPGAVALVRAAAEAGVGAFDTAPVYGEAESVLGEAGVATPVHTKLAPGQDPVASVRASLARLRRDTVEVVLLHDPDALLLQGPAAVASLLPLVGTEIGALGVSAYTADQLETAISTNGVTVVQIPLSVADRRLLDGDQLDRARDAGLSVVARSVFLQGALLLPVDRLPPHLAPLGPWLERLDAIAIDLGWSRDELCVRFVAALAQIDGLVFGIEGTADLARDVALLAGDGARGEVVNAVRNLPALPDEVVDPRSWPAP